MADNRGAARRGGDNFDADFSVSGANDFYVLSKALKHAGEKQLRIELNKGMKAGVRPLIPLIRAAALSKLPKRGGLAARMAKRPITAVTRTGKDPGVSLVMRKAQKGYLDGNIRHPNFKGIGPVKVTWSPQKVDGDWFDGTIEDNVDKVLPALKDAIDVVLDKVVKGAT